MQSTPILLKLKRIFGSALFGGVASLLVILAAQEAEI
jgi:hypothetical protein